MNINPDKMEGTPDDFDRLLDRGLASYSGAEPRVGLERRVLASLSEEVPTQAWTVARLVGNRRRNWSVVGGLVVVCILLVDLVLMVPVKAPHLGNDAKLQPRPGGREPATESNLARVQPAGSQPIVPAWKGSRSNHLTHSIVQIASAAPLAARRDEFGPPRATAEELLVARVAAEHPEYFTAIEKTGDGSSPNVQASPKAIQIAPIPAHPIVVEPVAVAPIQIASLSSTN